jgi:glucose-1-phosphate thymidylyltransferase
LVSRIEGIVECEESLQGRIIIGKNSRIQKGAILRGPTIIGENSNVQSGVYIGPYTSVGNNVSFLKGEIENSIIMDGCEINSSIRITDSIIANNSKVIDLSNSLPRGYKLLLGERSQVLL